MKANKGKGLPFVSEFVYTWFRNIIRHPKYGWWVAAAAVVYLVSPFDLSPDMLPIVGWLDDGLLATLVVTEVSQLLVERFKQQKQGGTVDPIDTAPMDTVADVS
jgi:uncharacterized membrane protein YkvA (DUF1232 family)